MTRFLIIGKSGQLGWELERAVAPLGEVVAVDKTQLNLTNVDAVRAVVREIQPSIILNSAAYTAVDRAEAERDTAGKINAEAPGVLADEARRLGAALVHYSTDYVFAGDKTGPYVETDTPAPLNEYGRSKLAGEAAITESGARSLIFRTSWLYGARGQNFLLTMLKLGREREELRIVNDQIGAPTWVRWVAETTALTLAQILRKNQGWPSGQDSLYHLSCSGETSWHGFAMAIFSSSVHAPRLAPIPSSEFRAAAARPKNSRLSTDKLKKDFGVCLPSWEQGLALCLKDISPNPSITK